MLGGSPISWKSKKQPTVALSSAEAEYRSMRAVTAELSWLTRLLSEMLKRGDEQYELAIYRSSKMR